MDTIQKLAILGEGAAQEHELAAGQSVPAGQAVQAAPGCFTPSRLLTQGERHRNPSVSGKGRFLPGGIHISRVGGGRTVKLLKVLQTNVCEFDCFYCEHRASRDVPRTYVSPDELAKTFMQLHRARLVEGLFLSSGITKKVDTMQERIVQTAELLRHRYYFKGYIHLKVMPGSSPAAVERTVQLADRVSLNLEAPTPRHLARLSSRKEFLDGILTRMVWINRITQAQPGLARAGQITQFVVGAAGESDRDLLQTTDRLYREIKLRRAYFSAFSPIPGTPLDGVPPAPLLRQHRLYQADWLLRFYGFSVDELAFDEQSHLPLAADPKLAWALRHPEFFPLELSTAPPEMLLRVPGIGPLSAKRVVEARRTTALTELAQLTRLGVVAKRAAPFLLIGGRAPAVVARPAHRRIAQLAFWPATTPGESR
ncbi:MAG: putative DNA modification/repair radical SAM protein [Nitrospirae bacterium]|nr:putative DNA modification/repair radical SAM protein [Nitrospirota bacterium]